MSEKMPEYPQRKTFEYVEGIAVSESEVPCQWDDYDALRAHAEALQGEVERLREDAELGKIAVKYYEKFQDENSSDPDVKIIADFSYEVERALIARNASSK